MDNMERELEICTWESRVSAFLSILKKYFQEEEGQKVPRIERIIYALLLGGGGYKVCELEIAEDTGMYPADVSRTLKEMKKNNWVFVESLGKGKKSLVTLNMKKLLEGGLPLRKEYEWKILKFMNEVQDQTSAREIHNEVWKNHSIPVHPYIFVVIANMEKRGWILNKGKNGAISLTNKGKIAFDPYKKKNIIAD